MLNSEGETLTGPPVGQPRVISVVKVAVEINRAGSLRMAYSSADRSNRTSARTFERCKCCRWSDPLDVGHFARVPTAFEDQCG